MKSSSEAQQKLASALTSVLNARPKAEAPERLFHYTTAAGFRSIVESGVFWATQAEHTNDASELRYGISMAENVIQDMWDKERRDPVKEIFRRLQNGLSDNWTSNYLVCFCEEGNLLEQWRAYGKGEPAFSLGLTKLDSPPGWLKWSAEHELFRVLYDQTEQKALFSEAVGAVIARFHEMTSDFQVDVQELQPIAVGVIRNAIQYLALGIKHPSFKSEREWRIVLQTTFDDPDVKFRTSRFGITAFLELAIQAEAGVCRGKLPLAQVFIGPSVFSESTGRTLTAFLKRKDYHFVEVTDCELPLRF